MPHIARLTAVAFASISLLGWAGRADAAVPADFYGVWGTQTIGSQPHEIADILDYQVGTGARHLRFPINWRLDEPEPGAHDLEAVDAFIAAAAERGLRLLPFIVDSPAWATTAPPGYEGTAFYPPRDTAAFGRFAAYVAARYGHDGSFWREHPELPYVPIRHWQIWNEPSIRSFWPAGPDPRGYVALLRAASESIREVDPRAQIVAAGIPNSTLGSPMIEYIDEMYAAGGARWFDVLAIHPYTRDVRSQLSVLRSVRYEMDAHGDPSPMWASEFGWPTGGEATSITVTEEEQAELVETSLRRLAAARDELNLRGVTYYAWRDGVPPPNRDIWTAYTGLLREDGSDKPARAAYAAVATALAPPLSIPPSYEDARGTGDTEGAADGDEAAGERLRLAVGARRVVRLGRRGRLGLRVGCHSPAAQPCSGRVWLAAARPVRRAAADHDVPPPIDPGRAGRRLAHARFTAAPGRSTRVVLRLSRRGLRMVRRSRRLRVRVDARARDGAGHEAAAVFGFWLKPGRR